MLVLCVWGAAWMVANTPPTGAVEVLPGPIPATLSRVIDGDTVEVRARIWLGQDVQVVVRLPGIDAPELRGKCSQERALAKAASDQLLNFEGDQVALLDVVPDKFGGRVLARVRHEEVGDLSTHLLESGFVRAYDGGERRGWCSELALTD